MDNNKAFFLKYRPIQLKDLVGQERVVKALSKQAEKGQYSHAYLLSGQVGSGKTTIARILASLMTCEHKTDGFVCATCETCRSIHEGQCVDVIEIDAASNRGIGEARLIKDGAYYAPQSLSRKIYIIDECHALTAFAWDALLKIVEEPPAYIVFIFCTTGAGKVPPAILSRCQRYTFGRVPTDKIVPRLGQVAKRENFAFDEAASLEIARMANGSMRDALSMLEAVSVPSGGQVSVAAVREHFGLPEKQVIYELSEMIANRDAVGLMSLVNDLLLAGVECRAIAVEISDILRNALVFEACGKDSKLLEVNNEEKGILQQLANKLGRTGLIQISRNMGRIDQELALNINARWILEAQLLHCISYVSSEVAKTKQSI